MPAKKLTFFLDRFNRFNLIARLSSPTIHTLDLSAVNLTSANAFAILDQFLTQCQGIRELNLARKPLPSQVFWSYRVALMLELTLYAFSA
jgi:hypothetical protein